MFIFSMILLDLLLPTKGGTCCSYPNVLRPSQMRELSFFQTCSKLCSGSSLAWSWVQHLTLPFPAAYACLSETLKKDDLSQQIIQAFYFLWEEDVIRTWLSSKAHTGEPLVPLHDSPAAEKSCGRKECEFVGPALRMNPASTTALQLLNSYLQLNPALLSIWKRKLKFC